jgi:hypothetical protein
MQFRRKWKKIIEAMMNLADEPFAFSSNTSNFSDINTVTWK